MLIEILIFTILFLIVFICYLFYSLKNTSKRLSFLKKEYEKLEQKYNYQHELLSKNKDTIALIANKIEAIVKIYRNREKRLKLEILKLKFPLKKD